MACEGKGPFFRVHCGPHWLNLVNGTAIAALRSTGSIWLDKLHLAVKLLRKQFNLIEKMGSQCSYHVELSWSSRHQVLLWNRAKSTELSEFYTEVDSVGFSDLAEAPGWWLFLCSFQEHYKLIKEALSAIICAVLITAQQNKILIQLRKELSELHCTQESATAHIAEVQEDELPFDTVLGITTMGKGLETRASLGGFSVCYRDIIEKSCELGKDTRDVYDDLDTECDEEKIDVARDVAAIALTSVHGLDIMDLQSSQEGLMLPPAVPLSLLDM
jgi:hypothetical protein